MFLFRCILAAFFVCCAALLANPARAQVLAESTFSTGAEGWTAVHFASTCIALGSPNGTLAGAWVATGGAPGGYFTTPDGSNQSFFRAPAPFRGNLSAAYGGTLRFEYRLTTTDADVYYEIDDVYLQGAGLTLIADTAQASRNAWGQSQAILLPAFWRVGSCTGPLATEAQLRSVLAAVSELYIRGEHVNGTETNDLDSVVIDATPAHLACPAAWDERDDAEPSARWRHAVAVDSDRGILVLFGGDTGENDTWEYHLAAGTWSRFQPIPSPSRRGGHAMIYDRARRKIVMTGGGYLGNTAEVWEYDTQSHAWNAATPLPQARAGHSMAYDSARNTTVLYGGLGTGVAGSVDVLERSAASSAWVARPADVNPGPQIGYAMAYDAQRARTVLIGQGTTAVSVAEWNGAAGTWDLRSFSGSIPAARANPAVAYDAARQRIVLVGGEGNQSTWDYDGATWVSRAALPTNSRDEHALTYDTVNNRVILSGGILGSRMAQRDLLAFNGTSNQWSTVWSRINPGQRDLFAFAYDEVGQRAILFGGGILTRPGIVQQFSAATLAFDGDAWTILNPSGTPGDRWFVPMVYDSSRRKLLAYGGATGNGAATATARLWELDLATLAWSDRGTQLPGQRYDHAAAFDRARNQLVIHGGVNELGTRIGDTWIYTPSTNSWVKLPDTEPSPGLRNGSSMVYDEHRGVIVLFGGHVGAAGLYDNSTWEWNGSAWANVTPASGNPPARLRPRLVYDPDRQRVLMFAGVYNLNSSIDPNYAVRAYDDLWEWNGLRWSRVNLTSSPSPTALVFGNAVYDRARHRLVHFGGSSIYNGTYRNGQTWDLILPLRSCGSSCPADLSGDHQVDDTDFVLFAQQYDLFDCTNPAMPYGCPADLNRDNQIDDTDFVLFAQAYDAFLCP